MALRFRNASRPYRRPTRRRRERRSHGSRIPLTTRARSAREFACCPSAWNPKISTSPVTSGDVGLRTRMFVGRLSFMTRCTMEDESEPSTSSMTARDNCERSRLIRRSGELASLECPIALPKNAAHRQTFAMDNGTKLASHAMLAWSADTRRIARSRAGQANAGYLHRKFQRDSRGLIERRHFTAFDDACKINGRWRIDCDARRTRRSLGQVTSKEHVAAQSPEGVPDPCPTV